LLAGIACAMLGATAAPAPAAAPCWKVLLNDWLDGRIDQLYPVSCYRAAINHLPTDIETYSSARDDILRALQARIAGNAAPPNKNNQSGGGTPPGSTGGGGNNSSNGDGNSPDSGGGPINDALNAGRPGSVDAVPLPLIVLSAIAGLLLALGAAGLIARRMQTKRVQMRPAESPAPPPNP
jgi:hypothetical protein